MPIYEYICLGCGEDFEAVCLSSTIKARCPACASAELKKKISRPGRVAAGSCSAAATGGG